ncbi:NXPE family member 1-like [Leptodactylus fuscus]|uniref:NXPE family member 1-like n=1 Tax=Leptodactylus fuscus TaxID=238119 RepID=UPI003F4EAB34
MRFLLSYKGYLLSFVAFCLLVSLIYYQNLKECFRPVIPMTLFTGATQHISEIQVTADKIFNKIDQSIPRINVTDRSTTTSPNNSKVYLKHPKDSYCVGDHLTVQVDMFDYLGRKKSYGGDYLRARIYTPELEAGSSGRIEDFNNGSYLVHFILFWEGKVNIEVLLMHPSEGASALWTYRNKWHGYVDHMGKFVKPELEKEVICGFDLDKNQELCEYKDVRDEEYFYCMKPQNFTCDHLSEVKSWCRNDKTLLTTVEKSLFDKSSVRAKIPTDFLHISVSRCNHYNTTINETCKTGMKLNYPSGYAMKNVWYPHECSTLRYESLEDMGKCLQGKLIHMFGDSTVKQWFYYMEKNIKTLRYFHLNEDNWSHQLLNLDIDRNMRISWKRHTLPFVTMFYQSWKEERTIAHEIDLIGGNNRTIIVLNIGVHFRPYPVYHFIRRLYHIRRAIERLFIRSPETKVIIKTENTGPLSNYHETLGDFHASIHYIIMEIIFKDLNVGFVNGWDMTNAFDTNDVHPPEKVIGNEVKMMMTYIC